MDATLLIADSDESRQDALSRFFASNGFRVATAPDGLECVAELVASRPHVLVIALEIPWGGGEGVIARLNDGLPIGRKPIVLVIRHTGGTPFGANRRAAFQLFREASAHGEPA